MVMCLSPLLHIRWIIGFIALSISVHDGIDSVFPAMVEHALSWGGYSQIVDTISNIAVSYAVLGV